MKKIFLALLSTTVVMFSGCASKSVTPQTKSGLEGTKVSAYLVGDYIDTQTATSRLKAAGFEIVATYVPIKQGTTIVFTNAALRAEAAKPGRSFMAVLRLFIDDKEKMISVTNPVYFGKAFMQDEYNHAVFGALLEALGGVFVNLRASKDAWDYDGLADYHFMVGMPYYSDVELLGKASATTAEAVAKLKAYKGGKGLVFELKLSQSTTLVGYDLAKRTKRFVKKVGRANAAVLPWCISIENGQAKALSAKYYIAISYPLLSMTEFMGISTVPGAITKDLQKPFK